MCRFIDTFFSSALVSSACARSSVWSRLPPSEVGEKTRWRVPIRGCELGF